jgi:hypothetical protein
LEGWDEGEEGEERRGEERRGEERRGEGANREQNLFISVGAGFGKRQSSPRKFFGEFIMTYFLQERRGLGPQSNVRPGLVFNLPFQGLVYFW